VIEGLLPRGIGLAPINVVFIGAALLTFFLLMMVTANDNQNNATAFGRTDAPQHTVVARNARIPYRWKQKMKLGAWDVRTTNDSPDFCRPERAAAIISQALKSANIDICALSEVRENELVTSSKRISPFIGVVVQGKRLLLVSRTIC